MQSAPTHLSTEQLEERLEEIRNSPRDAGPLEAIVLRPGPGERETVTTAKLSPAGGIDGDRWASECADDHPDDHPHRRSQVSLMNARILRLISSVDEAMCLAGDNLVVDLNLSEANLPAGSRLAIGDVVLELTDQPHTGCGQFAARYGRDAVQFVNGPHGKPLNLRGRYARIVSGGTVHVGDTLRKA
jgi:MOSC domain-containing protein YiiM